MTTGNSILDYGIAALEGGVAIGALCAGLGYCVGQYRKGSNDGKLAPIEAANAEFIFLKNTVASQSERISGLESHVARLQGQLDHKDSLLEATTKERDDLKAQANLQAISPALNEFVTGVAGKNYQIGVENKTAIEGLGARFDSMSALLSSMIEAQKAFAKEVRAQLPERTEA